MEDRRVTLSEIAIIWGISTGSVVEILHDHLQMSKVSARWVPRLLTAQQKLDYVNICHEILGKMQQEGEDFCYSLITVDECWLPYSNPQNKISIYAVAAPE